MDKPTYDTELKNIEELTWLPWIGENYTNLPSDKKILLVGESHYYEGEISCDIDESSTRNVVKEIADDKANYKLFQNTIRLLVDVNESTSDKKKERRQKFWTNVAFYNFVQRGLKKKTNEKASRSDFSNGWKPFFELIAVIKPSVCVFLGTTSAQHFIGACIKSKINFSGFSDTVRINGAIGKYGLISLNELEKCEVIFIKHPSSRFSFEGWRNFIFRNIPKLKWLEEVVNN